PQVLESWRLVAVVDDGPELLASLAQDGKEALPADRGKAMTPRREDPAAKVHVDVVPGCEVFREALVESGVGVLDPAQRLVREDDPESERVVWGVPLPGL